MFKITFYLTSGSTDYAWRKPNTEGGVFVQEKDVEKTEGSQYPHMRYFPSLY